MNSFMTFIQEKLTPIANFFGAQRHFSAMQKGFMATVSFILVSAIFMIIALYVCEKLYQPSKIDQKPP